MKPARKPKAPAKPHWLDISTAFHVFSARTSNINARYHPFREPDRWQVEMDKSVEQLKASLAAVGVDVDAIDWSKREDK